MYKLIIFDLDGTLLNSIQDLAFSMNHALQIYKYPTHQTEAYKQFIGNGVTKLIERALPQNARTTDCISMIKHEFVKHYNSNSDKHTKPYDGIKELLQTLIKENYKLAIASNKFHEATVELSRKFFPTIQFNNVLGQRDGIPTKPAPNILNEIIEKTSTPKNQVLYIGDSGVDAATAMNANVDFVGVLWGFRTKTELEHFGSTKFATNTDELLTIIKNKF